MIGTRCHIGLFFIVGICILFALPCSSSALGMEAGPYGPDSLFAIDKSSQTLFHFRKNDKSHNLDLVRKIPCTTGKVTGDKFREGDMKTPEGIYFIQGKKEGGLNFGLYGDLAFVLNFPNPVDQAKGKTGHGIWMHGRGKPIKPHETRGCVALNNSDIKTLQSDVRINTTPVLISDALSLDNVSQNNADISSRLIGLTEQWAKAWDEKSFRFFSFYDSTYFSSEFTEHKKRLFQEYPWIDVIVDGIKCIAGKDYCVTYFSQLYTSPGFSSEGMKRLYWKKTDTGAWKIIGSEWFKTPTDLKNRYVQKMTRKLQPWLERWRYSWEQGNLDRYLACYADDAVQGAIRGRAAIGNHKRELIQLGKKPAAVVLGAPEITSENDMIHVRCVQEYESESGYADRGIKQLVLTRTGEDDWQIVSETWTRLDS